jgi:hypothetical protein
MTEHPDLPPVAPAPAQPSQPAAAGTTTRGQRRRDNEDSLDAEESDRNPHDQSKKKKDKELFKGTTEKMYGNVFQLATENRKGNQFTRTMLALKDYVASEYDYPLDLGPLFRDPCEEADIDEPADEAPMSNDGVNRVGRDHRLFIVWKDECMQYTARVQALETNKHRLFSVILAQCSQSVKMKLEAANGYHAALETNDCHWLLTNLKNICHRFEHTENRWMALVQAKAAIFNYRQGNRADHHRLL